MVVVVVVVARQHDIFMAEKPSILSACMIVNYAR